MKPDGVLSKKNDALAAVQRVLFGIGEGSNDIAAIFGKACAEGGRRLELEGIAALADRRLRIER